MLFLVLLHAVKDSDLQDTETSDDPPTELISDLIGRPKNLGVTLSTQKSITLKWEFAHPSGIVDGYKIYYVKGPEKEFKTSWKSTPLFELQGLDPFTTYKIWIVAIVDGHESDPSESILANTDVDQPSSPFLVNASCVDTGKIYVQWRKPEKFDNSVDYYKLYHRPVSEPTFKSITIIASGKEDNLNYIIDNLATDGQHVIKVCAGTKSLSDPNKTWLGEPSVEALVYLPFDKCTVGVEVPTMTTQYLCGIIAGVSCAVFIIFIVAFLFMKKRIHTKQQTYCVNNVKISDLNKEHSSTNFEERFGPDFSFQSISLEQFPEHVAQLHMDGDIGFSKEYDEIQNYCKKNVQATHENSSLPENKSKNRYLNIVSYDHSRVQLGSNSILKKSTDYINANFIDSFNQPKAYIGTQGPLDQTFESFWQMIWEQNVFVIVMITNLIERGRKKCDQYWPKEDTETYGLYEATLLKEDVMANFTIRSIKLKHTKIKGSAGTREIKQFHYTSWPDHGAPSHPLPVLSYIRKSLAANPADGGPIVVHCSAGVGRTGTYIAIDSMLQQAHEKKQLNVYGFLKHIRGQRNFLVQTEEQYVFLHDALLEAITSGNTEVSKSTLKKYLENLKMEFQAENKTTLQKQFHLVTSFVPSESHRSSGRSNENSPKNRDENLIPVEGSRITISPKPGVEGSDYINATWLHGHSKLREFILTQHPKEEYLEDFWRMLWDHNAQTIVLLSSVDNEDFVQFWPSKSSDLNLETFRVRFIEETDQRVHQYIVQDFAVSSSQDDNEVAVRIIHCPGWPESVGNVEEIFNALNVTQELHLEYQNGPLIVVDRFGGREGAIFCALTTLCKELDTFGTFDVYQVAKLYHNKRPGIWKSSDDLLYLYNAMQALNLTNRMNTNRDSLTTGSTSINMSPVSNGISGDPWQQTRIKKSLSGFGLSSSSAVSNATDEDTAIFNATIEDTAITRRFSFPASFKNFVSNGTANTIKGPEDNDDDESQMQKAPLLKANSSGV